ncbi:ATP-binding cassette domain-containing protein [Bacillus sp. UNCCL81]|uniref:ABC transporter ATP-binding protein n=1 Tax=Bacillus sp. UNCCL81 TaxID=1502755 RepID=UPI0008ECA63C|nr:ATP-binding cassette domain-containing protein [Bacillus sp. UNCCL81]SFD61398.1 ABC-2 type transport system ATP-binding protein [Bacillus sp. UNCCL81]
MPVIEVDQLIREFRVHGNTQGSFRLLKRLFTQGGSVKRVVDNVSFSIEKGEFVGYIGPNGAGKSTTIKILSGVLVPTNGKVLVNGIEPYKQRKVHSRNIGVVFGQRTQLWWDLPLIESFKLLGKIYNIPSERFKANLNLFTELLDMESFLKTPVRQLSLGQRMRGDITAALLHDPDILFLDEPTIGLDLVAKEKIQNFLKRINKEKKVTIILTTHNLDDIERLCSRVIFINKGKVHFDGSSQEMIQSFGEHRYIVVEAKDWNKETWQGPDIEKVENGNIWFRVHDDTEIAIIIKKLADIMTIQNLTIKEPKIEDIIMQMYTTSRR